MNAINSKLVPDAGTGPLEQLNPVVLRIAEGLTFAFVAETMQEVTTETERLEADLEPMYLRRLIAHMETAALQFDDHTLTELRQLAKQWEARADRLPRRVPGASRTEQP